MTGGAPQQEGKTFCVDALNDLSEEYGQALDRQSETDLYAINRREKVIYGLIDSDFFQGRVLDSKLLPIKLVGLATVLVGAAIADPKSLKEWDI